MAGVTWPGVAGGVVAIAVLWATAVGAATG